ncbi:unnamed protein product, partial [Mesorhabditis belari]|uniref:Uncharacterized protein n=1 Tax=Mesorhabditis belari TaxID=2138241 RepID=A0AAF3EMD2_9BILA
MIIFLIVELWGFVFSFTIELLAIYVVVTSSAYHENFRYILGTYLFEHVFSQLCRMILILFQFDTFTISGNVFTDLPIFICSQARIQLYVASICALYSIVMERSFATYYLRDYEHFRRAWVQVFCFGYSVPVQVIAGLIYAFFGVNFTRILFIMMFIIVNSQLVLIIGTFLALYWYNHKKFNSLTKDYEIRKYSLSIRFQLEENLRALHMVGRGVLGHALFCIFGMVIFAGPFICFPIGSPELELGVAALEAIVSIYGIILISGILIIEPSFRRKTRKILLSFLRRNRLHPDVPIVKMKKRKSDEEANIYFGTIANTMEITGFTLDFK